MASLLELFRDARQRDIDTHEAPGRSAHSNPSRETYAW
jgi:hypothetical protein